MLLAAARRFLALLASVGGVTLLGSVALGGLAGASLRRSAALGLYFVGSFLLLVGFLVGNRGVLRAESAPENDRPLGFFGVRRVRTTTAGERRETMSLSAIVITLGLALLLFGVVADEDNELV